jgi:hypothetical protein
MAMVSPATAAANWSRSLAASTEKIKAGVNSVNESPTAKAARRADAYLAGIQRAVADGRWQDSLNAVSLESWKQDMLNKGLPRIASGATAAQAKMQNFLTQFLPHVQQGKAMLESMPRGGLEENIQRMTAMVRHNAQFRYQKRA